MSGNYLLVEGLEDLVGGVAGAVHYFGRHLEPGAGGEWMGVGGHLRGNLSEGGSFGRDVCCIEGGQVG